MRCRNWRLPARRVRPIPGGRPPYFEETELFVPVDLFGLFNELVETGEIVVGT
jgi:hypothetical protein